jgi:hypothetical protein
MKLSKIKDYFKCPKNLIIRLKVVDRLNMADLTKHWVTDLKDHGSNIR